MNRRFFFSGTAFTGTGIPESVTSEMPVESVKAKEESVDMYSSRQTDMPSLTDIAFEGGCLNEA